ncbi:hypothetical protein C7B69_10960 [filamentous cyanobacterium Phorm 46]|nr:hypothetical protein C7B69_10960 [filamentous cyanobacterium Phorm 46]
MKPTVLFSSTILAIITVMQLSQASKALPTPVTVRPTVNESVETLFKSSQSKSWRRCRYQDGGSYPCPRFVMPSESPE